MTIKYSLKRIILPAIVALAMLSNAQAAEALKMELQANKITKTADGKVSYIAASNAQKGETVQYRATYTNTIDTPISDVSVTLPIPANMVFTGEAKPNSAQATIDGKNYADMPLMRKVDGKLVKIPLSEYKALRWNIKWLPASKSADVSLNTTVN
ncbi:MULTISPECIES: hypothetical protein [unclassified Psychrobacter]|uniref:hypothetical protein n=1 Tax=unclassified Psychrobacter TaxID=196806 RepID=UPI0025B2B349|nr:MULTISPECIES: hypothetical protein [unclassified Psychrobacter]MDN3453829.1 hypothetical protein [Psychrobacter sp. APC 3350]MDN3501561.1 hypothetical protein [Psychrobacter sp. 5A.1]